MIQIETTPNPDSLKFLTEKVLSTIGSEEFKKENKNEIKIPFIREILDFKGVELILISEKFLSVKKTKEVSWNELKPMIISHLNDYLEKNIEPIQCYTNSRHDTLQRWSTNKNFAFYRQKSRNQRQSI